MRNIEQDLKEGSHTPENEFCQPHAFITALYAFVCGTGYTRCSIVHWYMGTMYTMFPILSLSLALYAIVYHRRCVPPLSRVRRVFIKFSMLYSIEIALCRMRAFLLFLCLFVTFTPSLSLSLPLYLSHTIIQKFISHEWITYVYTSLDMKD